MLMHYFKRNIGDYHKKAGRLNMLQHGAYTLLMDACYDRERFPTREEAIDWCWASSEAEIAAVDLILAKFFELHDGVYKQDRIAEEIEQYHANAATNARIAQEREAKKKEQKARSVNESYTVSHEPPPNHKPLTINQEPVTNIKDIVPANAVTKTATGTRLDADWQLPKELGNWALEQGLNKQQVILEGEKFRDHWIAQAGAKGRKADWPATWRNWVRNSKTRQPKTFYEITKEQKERDADKRLTGLSNASMADLEELGLARDGKILGS